MDLPRLFQFDPPPDLQPELATWFDTELGRALLQAERTLLDNVVPELFGYHAVQLGQVVGLNLLEACPIRHRCVVGSAPAVEGLSPLVAHTDQLPFAADTMDLVLLHHSVDTAANPHALLREASRVLISGGHLLVVGFNPWSLWGVWRLLRFPWTRLPWLRRHISPQRLADWMRLLDFEVVGLESAFFAPPFTHGGLRRRFAWLEHLGQRWWSQRGASYVLLARKHEFGMTPIRNRIFTPQRALAPIFVEPHAGRSDHWAFDKDNNA